MAGIQARLLTRFLRRHNKFFFLYAFLYLTIAFAGRGSVLLLISFISSSCQRRKGESAFDGNVGYLLGTTAEAAWFLGCLGFPLVIRRGLISHIVATMTLDSDRDLFAAVFEIEFYGMYSGWNAFVAR